MWRIHQTHTRPGGHGERGSHTVDEGWRGRGCTARSTVQPISPGLPHTAARVCTPVCVCECEKEGVCVDEWGGVCGGDGVEWTETHTESSMASLYFAWHGRENAVHAFHNKKHCFLSMGWNLRCVFLCVCVHVHSNASIIVFLCVTLDLFAKA